MVEYTCPQDRINFWYQYIIWVERTGTVQTRGAVVDQQARTEAARTAEEFQKCAELAEEVARVEEEQAFCCM